MLISNCCEYPPTFEVNENEETILGHCSKCGEHATFEKEEE